MTRHRQIDDDGLRGVLVQWRRARVREANELGELAGVEGVVRALSPDEWATVLEYRRRRAEN
jgi:hypothetical protein